MSTLHALTVPKWGMSMEEGEITEWRVEEGDRVSVGDEIVDIETSKIVNTAESHCNGTLVRIVAQPGEVHRVAMLLGVVAEGDVSEAEIDAFISNYKPDATALNQPLVGREEATRAQGAPNSQAKAEQPQRDSTVSQAATTLPKAPGDGTGDAEVFASTVARRLAKAHGINLHDVTPTGHHGRISKWDVEKAAGVRIQPAKTVANSPLPKRAASDDSRTAATPVARRLARKLNINLNDVTPTGRHNRVTKGDIELAARATSGMGSYTETPLSGMRKAIAGHLSESKQTIPHFRVSLDIELDSLLAQRKYMNDTLGHEISVNDFIVKACASALQRVPEVNVQFTGDGIRQFEQADISIAVALENGLMTPVIRRADSKSLPQIAADTRALVKRAHAGQLALDEIRGGSFTVSNLGMYGVDQFDAIINMPQAAILAVGAGRAQPVVRDGNLVAATVMRVSMSSDHRAIDGATAARFLQALKGFLENPASMLL
ncbi:2-oxo acid dehydrogenase subunit E2 [Microbulbifer elongatus]|uniref:2-oxo acid dehydrogenase subunit E2 n=1 Tax=Microbulbifer elongatus TaxID=86173 RepID=UPI001CFF3D5C|nr:2-oxo acid dehydrogenase subunit E2 [Microbulbifer elongatus]